MTAPPTVHAPHALDRAIGDICESMAALEDRLRRMRAVLNRAIVERRTNLGPDVAVCPVCGDPGTITAGGNLADHVGPRATQCRGSGIPANALTIPMDGGL